jgi:hypothetical protein
MKKIEVTPMTARIANSKDRLMGELEADADSAFQAGKVNNRTDMALSIAAVMGSLAAAVLAAAPSVLHVVLGAVAAIPAACATLQKTVQFRERSYWYFQYASRARALAMTLEFAETPDLSDLSKQRAEIELDMEKHWGQFGGHGATPVKPGDAASKKRQQPKDKGGSKVATDGDAST